MKRYKVLLVGKNNTIKDDFFTQIGDAFYLLTTSMRIDDFLHHLELFEPEVLVFCVSDDKREDWSKIMEYRARLRKKEIVTVAIGSPENCENFQKMTINMADLILNKPITAYAIRENIQKYMEQIEREKAEAEEKERQRLEEERKLKEQNERKHVLVIDDDPIMLKMIKEHLHEKYDVATAISGKIAHKFLETKKTNLILLDYEMPGENGPEVLKKIRENEALAEIPVIFLTGITEKDKITQALILKPQGYLLKPIDKTKLMDTIEQFIG